MKTLLDNYRKYKWFFTSNDHLVVGGKNAVKNEELLHLIKKTGKNLIVLHTSSPGSPFSIILEDSGKVDKKDLEEAAIFTACFSQAWKSGKKRADVDFFKSSQLNKPNNAKIGTWHVSGDVQTLNVPLELFLIKQKDSLRAVPESTAGSKAIIKITPGRIDKKDIIPKIELESKLSFSQEQILSALPAGGIAVRKL